MLSQECFAEVLLACALIVKQLPCPFPGSCKVARKLCSSLLCQRWSRILVAENALMNPLTHHRNWVEPPPPPDVPPPVGVSCFASTTTPCFPPTPTSCKTWLGWMGLPSGASSGGKGCGRARAADAGQNALFQRRRPRVLWCHRHNVNRSLRSLLQLLSRKQHQRL